MEEKKSTGKKTSTGKTVKKTSSKTTSGAKKVSSVKKSTTPKKESATNLKTEPKKEVKRVESLKSEENRREIDHKVPSQNEDTKNYVLRIVSVLLAVILIVVAGVKLYIESRETHYSNYWNNRSYLVENKLAKQITCDEIAHAIEGESKFVLVTYFGYDDMTEEEKKIMEQEFELEKDLANLIKANHLENDFYVYPLIDNCAPLATQNLQVSNFDKAPMILYYRDGALDYTVQREDELMINEADFAKLLDIYEFTK